MKPLLLCCMICLPLKNLQITSGYGYRIHPLSGKIAFHPAVDLRAGRDTVFAVMNGRVATVRYDKGLGIFLRLAHGPVETLYGHLSAVLVHPADSVTCGQPIAVTGSTGKVTAEHLHFTVHFKGQPLDPLEFIYQYILKNKHHE
ncbi:M23 family metallopeptidase [Mucilaginibacter sp. HD30]